MQAKKKKSVAFGSKRRLPLLEPSTISPFFPAHWYISPDKCVVVVVNHRVNVVQKTVNTKK